MKRINWEGEQSTELNICINFATGLMQRKSILQNHVSEKSQTKIRYSFMLFYKKENGNDSVTKHIWFGMQGKSTYPCLTAKLSMIPKITPVIFALSIALFGGPNLTNSESYNTFSQRTNSLLWIHLGDRKRILGLGRDRMCACCNCRK